MNLALTQVILAASSVSFLFTWGAPSAPAVHGAGVDPQHAEAQDFERELEELERLEVELERQAERRERELEHRAEEIERRFERQAEELERQAEREAHQVEREFEMRQRELEQQMEMLEREWETRVEAIEREAEKRIEQLGREQEANQRQLEREARDMERELEVQLRDWERQVELFERRAEGEGRGCGDCSDCSDCREHGECEACEDCGDEDCETDTGRESAPIVRAGLPELQHAAWAEVGLVGSGPEWAVARPLLATPGVACDTCVVLQAEVDALAARLTALERRLADETVPRPRLESTVRGPRPSLDGPAWGARPLPGPYGPTGPIR